MGGHRLEGRQVPAQPLITLALLVGHYCPAETISAHPCPEGTLNPQESAVSPRACQLCPAGSYCPGEGNTWPEGIGIHACRDRQLKNSSVAQASPSTQIGDSSYATLSVSLKMRGGEYP